MRLSIMPFAKMSCTQFSGRFIVIFTLHKSAFSQFNIMLVGISGMKGSGPTASLLKHKVFLCLFLLKIYYITKVLLSVESAYFAKIYGTTNNFRTFFNLHNVDVQLANRNKLILLRNFIKWNTIKQKFLNQFMYICQRLC